MTVRGSPRFVSVSPTFEAAGSLLLLLMVASASSQTPTDAPRQGCLEFGLQPPQECTRCSSGFFLRLADPREPALGSRCVSCIEGCLECDDPDLCLKCDARHTQRPTESTCEPCDASCETCGAEPSTCLSCGTLWVFYPDEHRCSLAFTVLGVALAVALLTAVACAVFFRRLRKKRQALSDELGTPQLRLGKSKKQSPKKQLLTEQILDEEVQRGDGRPIICSMDLIGMINRNMAISQVDQRSDGNQSHAEEYKGLFRSVK